MNINKEELKKVAENMSIELDEKEIDLFTESINKLTDNLDKIFEEKVEDNQQVRTNAQQKQIFDTPAVSKEENKTENISGYLNNYNNGKIKIKGEDNDN